METTTYKISDIGEVVGGGTPSTANSDFWGGDIPWISPKDLTGYKSVYISHGESFLTKTGLKSGTKLLPKGTVLFSSRAPIGYVAIASNPICTNQGFKSIICNKEIINPLFLYYYIKGNLDYIKLFGTGATFPEISGAAMRKIKVQIPTLPTQQKIASILSSYDRLIENNTRRIRLLEQMAENLYKEWFVRFRFPEHEKVEMVNGLPKGWERTKLIKNIKTSSGGTPSRNKGEYYKNGTIPWIKTGELQDCILINTEECITEDAVNNSSAKLFPKGTLLMAMYGVNVGKLGISEIEATCNQACCVFTPKHIDYKYYLFHYLKSIREYLLSISFGAAQQNLSQELIKSIRILFPDEKTNISFIKEVEPLFKEISIIQQQNQLLTRQRDLLLPRLMSGKLEVKS